MTEIETDQEMYPESPDRHEDHEPRLRTPEEFKERQARIWCGPGATPSPQT